MDFYSLATHTKRLLGERWHPYLVHDLDPGKIPPLPAGYSDVNCILSSCCMSAYVNSGSISDCTLM